LQLFAAEYLSPTAQRALYRLMTVVASAGPLALRLELATLKRGHGTAGMASYVELNDRKDYGSRIERAGSGSRRLLIHDCRGELSACDTEL
jgi:hypothetical protein